MRFFLRSTADAMFAINRCYFEADHGHAGLAVDRLSDLADEIPGNAHITYAEGIIRRDYLGQGQAARERFERAYELSLLGRLRKKTGYLAAYNAAMLARNEAEFRRWAERAVRCCPLLRLAERQRFGMLISELDRGIPYRDLLIAQSAMFAEDAQKEDHGHAAAALEIVQSEPMGEQQELAFRKQRANHLRELDRRDEEIRAQTGEAFPPDERIALREAMSELERALALDESDATLWNFKSSWCISLQRYEQGIHAADKAIERRPHMYPRPHVNKASCLYMLDRHAEAVASARESLRQAMALGEPEHIERSQRVIHDYSRPRPKPTLNDLVTDMVDRMRLVRLLSQEELAQLRKGGFTLEMLANRILLHGHSMPGQASLGYVTMMAQLLGDFTPETAVCALLVASGQDPRVGDHCGRALLYLAAHSQGVQRRDAARLLALMILSIPNADAMRLFYRQHILETAAAATVPVAGLDEIMRDALGRILPPVPALIADQPRVDDAGRMRARRSILSQLDGPPPVPIRSSRVAGFLAALFSSQF
jgi:hypothetical protein